MLVFAYLGLGIEMARVSYRVCKKTLPHDKEAVCNTLVNNANLIRDDYKSLWEVLFHSMSAFCPWKKYPKLYGHTHMMSQYTRKVGSYSSVSCLKPTVDTTLTQNRVSISSVWYKSGIDQSGKKMEVCILNKNEQAPLSHWGCASLPTHLCIKALASTMAQTIQAVDLDINFSPSSSHSTLQTSC